MSEKLYIGEAGIKLKVRVFEDAATEDLSTATNLKITIERPNGTVISETATIPVTTPTDKFLEYTLKVGDLNQEGTYKLHAEFTEGTNPFIGDKTTFTVFEKFKGPGKLDGGK